MFLSFVLISLYFPFIFLSFSFQCAFMSFHFPFISFHFAFMSFHFISKVMEMALWLGQGTECNKSLSLLLSLNNLSNIWYCSKEICHKNNRERERAQASWMPNDMETAGNRAPQVEFPSLFLPVLWMCTTVFAWFTPSLMDCRVWSQVLPFRFTFTVFCAHLWQKTPAILKWSSKNLTVIQIYMYIYIHNIYIYIYMYIYIMYVDKITRGP